MNEIGEILKKGLIELNLEVTNNQYKKLLDYLNLFEKWNKTYSLSAIRQPQEIVKKHLLDSLALVNILKEYFNTGEYVLDVGSGAGLPGIPLAIIFSDININVLDSNGKKTAFLQQVKNQLKLENITIINQRVEMLKNQEFQHIISRAFSSLKDYVNITQKLTQSLNKNKTLIWAMKGKYPEEELKELPNNYQLTNSYSLQVPGIDAERHLLKITRIAL